jgi:hypothetical protein
MKEQVPAPDERKYVVLQNGQIMRVQGERVCYCLPAIVQVIVNGITSYEFATLGKEYYRLGF